MNDCTSKKVVVCIHDVSPRFACEIETLIDSIQPFVSNTISLAVVPNWHGLFPLSDYPAFLSAFSYAEVLLHGYFHERRNGFGPISFLSARADEMNGVHSDELDTFLQAGQQMIENIEGIEVHGFLPPAWQPGPLKNKSSWHHKHFFMITYSALIQRDNADIPLCTWSWDCGAHELLGHAGDLYGRIRHCLPDNPVHVIALHPREANNRFLGHALRRLDRLLSDGYTPVVFEELLTC